MNNELVTDKMVSDALDFLAKAIEPAAAAKAERVRAEYARKRTRARLILECDGPMTIREAHAESSDEYEEACEREAQAVNLDERYRLHRNKAEAIIEAWRTMNANIRAAERIR